MLYSVKINIELKLNKKFKESSKTESILNNLNERKKKFPKLFLCISNGQQSYFWNYLNSQGFSTDSINFDSCRRKPVLLAFKVLS